MRRQDNIFGNIDWVVVVIYLLLTIFGWLNVYAVTYVANADFFDFQNPAFMQLTWIVISLLVVFLTFLLDSRFFSFVAYPFYGFIMFLLMAVLVIGAARHGARSWIVIGPASIQPSEFAKLATMLALARFISAYNFKISRLRDLILTFLIIGFPAILILGQPDFGSFLVFTAFLLVLYREGLSGWILIMAGSLAVLFLTSLVVHHNQVHYVLLIVLGGISMIAYAIVTRKALSLLVALGVGGGLYLVGQFLYINKIISLDKEQLLWISLSVLGLIALIYGVKLKIRETYFIVAFLLISVIFTYTVVAVFDELPTHHQDRINTMLGLISDKKGSEYNVEQSKIAIGSGQLFGQGFLKGSQTEGKFVPEQRTDFIFTSVGEQWGFIGSFGLVVLYSILMIRLVFIAERQRSRFSRIFGYGVLSVLFFHFSVNIGMTIGLFPTIGIPLPLISYGGSSFLAFSLMLFVMIRLDASRKTYLI